ncbi:S58 family peptidase [Segetibacter sp. 3557_3]|uniref:DmpA family aminopeptidase n=1 Tax=Segetibacter sp. 3557_3 TaxID=2547429 RepID=UPI00105889CE|nr:P1 family peptidase [Segetibacter sp. 3557_3]TDH21274.1 S58 family peptidase [Segetibacter sp. 3557_3]
MQKFLPILLILYALNNVNGQATRRARDYGINIGVIPSGTLNAITDVAGVRVGQVTLLKGDSIRTGVTAIVPYQGNIFQQKVPAAIFTGNGFGKLAGSTQVAELGTLETPIILTNTLSVATAIEALVDYTLGQQGNEQAQSVNAVVGETNDGWLNDIRGRHVSKADVLAGITTAATGPVKEGNVGAGTGTVCFGFKGGIGTSSRKLPDALGGYTVGVLVQTNFGGVLQIDGVPIGKELKAFSFSDKLLNNVDGSCMMVVATDAPLDSRNLERLAKRAFMGMAKTGGIASNGSGDYVIAFSTDKSCRVPHQPTTSTLQAVVLHNDFTSPLFMAAIEATEEAIINSLFAAETITGKQGHISNSLPIEKVSDILKKYNRIK